MSQFQGQGELAEVCRGAAVAQVLCLTHVAAVRHVGWIFMTLLNFCLKLEIETKILVFCLEDVSILSQLHTVIKLSFENTIRSYLLLMMRFICYIPSKAFVNCVLKEVGEVFVSQELNSSSCSSPAVVLLIVLEGNR